MEYKEIPLLRAEDLEIRPAIINDKGMSLLVYKNARVDMRVLDETYGPMNWQRSHQVLNGAVFCTVSIYDSSRRIWVSKEDAGASAFQDTKSDASDSFKRACFNIGIGRELYTAPFIWLKPEQYKAEKRDKWIVKDKFTVKSISYNEQREISALVIENQDGVVVFEMKEKTKREKKPDMQITVSQVNELHREMREAGVTLDMVLKRYALNSINEMDQKIYEKAMRSLEATKRKAA